MFTKRFGKGLWWLLAGCLLVGILVPLPVAPQAVTGTRPVVGIRAVTPQVHAFTGAKLVIAPGRVVENGTLVIRDGRVVAAGTRVVIPPDAVVHELAGKTVYPGFIDAYAPRLLKRDAFKDFRASHWNAQVRPELDVTERLELDEKVVKEMRNSGFVAALVVPPGGVIRGQSALVYLNQGPVQRRVLKARVAQHLGGRIRFRFGERPQYPTSVMGAIALVRQTLLDADWYQRAWRVYRRYPANPRPEVSSALAALEPVIRGLQPVVVEVNSEWDFLRAARIIKEFHLNGLIRGSGMEYRRLDAIRATRLPVILPVNFPEPPQVEDPEVALNVSLRDLMHWELAPENPARVQKAGLTFALTADGLQSVGSFRERVRQAIRRGLDATAALAALTTVPARLLGVADQLGTLDPGKRASFLISDGDIFDPQSTLREVWIDGQRYDVKPEPTVDPRGTWKATLKANTRWSHEVIWVISGTPERLKLELGGKAAPKPTEEAGEKKPEQLPARRPQAVSVKYALGRLTLTLEGKDLGRTGWIRLAGVVFDDEMYGTGELEDGTHLVWWAQRQTPGAMTQRAKREVKAAPEKAEPVLSHVVYPFGAFGRPDPVPPQPAVVLVRNATIWTQGPQGVLKNADLLVERGRIKAVGKGLKAPAGALVIDATGKHVTPGLIDAHSHTAIYGGVNEIGEAVTAEVRIGDVIDPDDINIYRELAGGLTVAHLLHGSANPIGGQNQVIKLRWGALDEAMKFAAAPPTIKFALGENPKQSNWPQATERYPQTRMGVEELIRDRFQAALEYKKRWEAYRRAKDRDRLIPPRRDLELEALVEVLEGKRFVHAHSYRQDEILALMRVAEDFGFHIQCFQHVLEGYKVADELARHGAGASTFSDWWAYKFEVYDAIPFNGALMWQQGVVVSFNSDSSELARRLNLEAAKAVKYGGVPPEEALKFVTLNPAIQLRVEHRVGSLEPGKDADFVIWSGDPLSTFSVVEQTWIDGRKYFDREQDLRERVRIRELRARLIQKALKARQKKRPRPRGSRPKRPMGRGS